MTGVQLLSIVLGSSLITSIVSFFLHRRTERISAEVNNKFDLINERLREDLKWKQSACQTLGELYYHLHRTKLGFLRYKKNDSINQFLEDEVLYVSNKRIRDLILENGYFIPPELTEDATALVEHYDVWLEKYHKMRVLENSEDLYIIVGPDGYRFPMDAEKKFKIRFLELWKELYAGVAPPRV